MSTMFIISRDPDIQAPAVSMPGSTRISQTCTTMAGKPYRNTCCWVFRFGGGKVIELVEYADTALMESTLQPPR